MAQEKHYEMNWDCQFCGTSKLLGKTHRFCPNCGGPQNPDARYFPPDDEKVAVEDHELVGRDVACPACGSWNSAKSVHCGTCGAPLEGGQEAAAIGDGDTLTAAQFSAYAQSRDVGREAHQQQLEAAAAASGDKEGGGGLPIGAIIGVVAVVVIGVLVFLFNQTTETGVIVREHEWTRTIEVEEFSRVSDGNWQLDVPSGAYNERCSQRQNGTRRVEDGQTCETVRRDNGDGTFMEREECQPTFREEPIIDTWCDYDIDRWEPGANVVTSGGLNDTPTWGSLDYSCANARIGCGREAGRTEVYRVIFEGDGDTYRCTFSQEEWADIPVESRWTLEVRALGGAACDTLAPQ
jgi:hypothetical protein